VQLSPSTKLGLIAFLVVDVALAVIFVSLYLLRADRSTELELREIGVTVYPEKFELSSFQLIDQNGSEFNNGQFLENWSLLFFGFTSCPDICPITMAELDRFADSWKENTSDPLPQIILATVDPATDSPDKLKDYLERFSPDFIGLTGEPNELAALAEELFVGYGEPKTSDMQPSGHRNHQSRITPGDFVIDHSSHISVIDPNGDLFAVIRPPHRARDLLKAVKIISE
jgi:protein SCO1